jgi:hypothetical protein
MCRLFFHITFHYILIKINVMFNINYYLFSSTVTVFTSLSQSCFHAVNTKFVQQKENKKTKSPYAYYLLIYLFLRAYLTRLSTTLSIQRRMTGM